VINSISGENLAFVSVRKATEFIGIHQSYIAKSLIKIFTRGGVEAFLFINLLLWRRLSRVNHIKKLLLLI